MKQFIEVSFIIDNQTVVVGVFTGSRALNLAEKGELLDLLEDAHTKCDSESAVDLYQQVDKYTKNRYSLQHLCVEEIRVSAENITEIVSR